MAAQTSTRRKGLTRRFQSSLLKLHALVTRPSCPSQFIYYFLAHQSSASS
uniref:Uncharacterized protein n=1 Tax=Anguilla anguilla TaxID=7936 RepID=A0A0E9U3V4_ANGAN